MVKYILRRFGEMIILLFIIFTATFFLLAAVPGNAIDQKMEKFPESVKENIVHKYGFDKPVLERYAISVKNFVIDHQFGESIVNPGVTLSSLLKDKMPISMQLSARQILFGVPIGMILGIIAACNRGKRIDYFIVISSLVITSVPTLVFALLLQKYFGGRYGLQIIGWSQPGMGFVDGLSYTLLPTLSGVFGYIVGYSRLVRTTMLDSINQEYTMTARAKGLSEARIIYKHVIRNSFIPVCTILPGTIAGVIGGSLFIERVFSIPGIGAYYTTAVSQRDIPMIMGQTMLYTLIYLVSILVSDILYTIVDPRIKFQ
ncbi:ABC transporter permease [Anaeromicropila herbilytica]|uniref:Peptide ABC transporter permease n=1 Tax=Anaeromicropila herbilytica TaxID=2785025 RepID=A0A7R7IF53_9FIRM|nr:ABC transporter permease [Anaeromicropila herbilytica]BCN31793.1 peptide ABC transporter permease [Anaeromicropila herbilytica]